MSHHQQESSRLNHIDFKIFNVGKGYKSKCEPVPNTIIKECRYLLRLTTALKYYDILKTTNNQTSQDIFTQFCIEMYQDLLDDIAHFHSEHNYELNEIKTELIVKYGFTSCDTKQCVFTQRHYDETRGLNTKKKEDLDATYSFYEQIMDSLHFNIFHLYDIGLRCALNTKEYKTEMDDHEDQDYTCIDEEFDTIKTMIHNKRKQYAKDRYIAPDNKFNINVGYNVSAPIRQDTAPMMKNTSADNVSPQKKNVWNSLRKTMSRYFGNNTETNSMNNSTEKTEITWTDNMFEYISSRGVDRAKIIAVYDIFRDEEYDTEAVICEFEEEQKSVNNIRVTMIMIKEPQCNVSVDVYNLAKSAECVLSIQDYIHNTKLSIFDTGFVFYYWPYYHPNEIKKRQVKHRAYDPSNFNINDYGGYDVADLFIASAYFNDLKHEIINSGHCSMEQWINKVELPSERYINTRKAKIYRADIDGMIGNLKNLHYGIQRNAPLSLVHIQCVLCYCDLTKLCTSFSSTFRAIFVGETLSSIKKRNQRYYYLSKYLREAVDYFGKKGKALDMTRHHLSRSNLLSGAGDWLNTLHIAEQGPFYCGVSSVLSMPSFNIRLCGPTSTSKQYEIAINFASDNGMIIQLNNNGDWYSRNLHFFDCCWISKYPEEDERLFFGGDLRIRVESVRIIQTKQNFKRFCKSLFYFDCMVNGSDMEKNIICHQREYKILDELIKHELGVSMDNIFDPYIYNTFHIFCQNKKTMCINLWYLDKYFNSKIGDNGLPLTNLLMYSVGNNVEMDQKQNNNLFRPLLFRLFPNLKQIIYYTDNAYNFDFEVFNALYSNIDSFKLNTKIVIKTEQQKGVGNRTWITKKWKSISAELVTFKTSLITTKGYYARGVHRSAAYHHPIQVLTIQKTVFL